MQERHYMVAVAVAVVALIVAVYAVATQPKPYQPPPTASATVKIADKVAVDRPGTYNVRLGWIYVKDAPAVVQLTSKDRKSTRLNSSHT